MDIKEFRSAYPTLSDYSDTEIVTALQQTHFKDYTEPEVAKVLGVHSPKYIDYSDTGTPAKRYALESASRQVAPVRPKQAPEEVAFQDGLNILNTQSYRDAKYEEQQDAKLKLIDNTIGSTVPDKYKSQFRDSMLKRINALEGAALIQRQQLAQDQFIQVEQWKNRKHTLGDLGAQFKEGTKELIKRPTVGFGETAKYFEKSKDFAKEERMLESTGLQNVPAGEQQVIGEAMSAAVRANGGRQLNQNQYKTLRLAVRNGNSKKYINDINSAITFVNDRLIHDPKYLYGTTFLEDVARMLPQVAGQVLAYVASGGAGSATLMALHIVGSSYEANLAAGVNPDRALAYGWANAIMQAPLELISIGKLVGAMKVGHPVITRLRKLGNYMGTEFLTEFLQAHPDAITSIMAQNPDAGQKEIADKYSSQLGAILKQGAYEGLVASVAGGAIGSVSFVQDMRKQAEIEKTKLQVQQAISEELNTLQKQIDKEESKLTPEATPDEKARVDSLKVYKKGLSDLQKVTQDPNFKGDSSIDDEMAQEKARYDELFEREKEEEAKAKEEAEVESETIPESPSVESREAVPETIVEPETPGIPEAKSAKEKLDTLKEATSWRRQSVKDMRKVGLSKDQATDLVSKYEAIPESDRNRNDNARLAEARRQLNQHKVLEKESKDLKKAMGQEEKAQETEVEERSRPLVSQGAVVPNVTPNIAIDPMDDKRPKRFAKTGLTNPAGQKLTKESAMRGGIIFDREGVLKDTKNNELQADLEGDMTDADWTDYNRKVLDRVEEQIANGTWKFQELFDRVVAGTPKLNLVTVSKDPRMNKNNFTTRGRMSAQFDPQNTTRLLHQTIMLDLANITGIHDGISGLEVVFAHELLHALHTQILGFKDNPLFKAYAGELHDIYTKIPEEHSSRIHNLIIEYDAFARGFEPIVEQFQTYTDEEITLRHNMWSMHQALRNLKRTDAKWDELMSYTMSDPGIMAEFNAIPSLNPDGTASKNDTILTRLVKSLLKYVDVFLFKGTMKRTLMDDIMDVHRRYVGAVTRGKQNYWDIKPKEEHKNSLYIKGNPKFPTGSKFLNPAFKLPDGTIKHSPLAHFEIITTFKENEPWGLDGFAAIDENDKPIAFFTRKEAATLVDPDYRIASNGILLSEDLPNIPMALDSSDPVIRKRGNTREIIEQADNHKKKRRQLSEADKALLEQRRLARGGKSLVETWAEKRQDHQKEIAAVKRNKEKDLADPNVRVVPNARWTYENAINGLNSMNDHTLEREFSRVNAIVSDMVQQGFTQHERLIYYKIRRDAISVIQEKRAIDKKRLQQLKENEMDKQAGKTERARREWFKKEYKRLKRIDAPYSAVEFTRNQLIDSMGDAFWSWSGEKPPISDSMKERIAKELGLGSKREIAPEAIQETRIDPDTGIKITVLKPLDEEGVARLEKGVSGVEAKAIAPNAMEARKKFDSIMSYMRDNFVATDKKLSPDMVDKISNIITQAGEMGALTESELMKAWADLMAVDSGVESSFESASPGKPNDTQKTMNKLMPVKVKFDGFFSKADGYVPEGYYFTITDPFHDAYKSSFIIKDLDPGTINKKFAEIKELYDQFKIESDSSVEWRIVDNDTRETRLWSSGVHPDYELEIDINHRVEITDTRTVDYSGVKHIIPQGARISTVAWSKDLKDGNKFYDRPLVSGKGGKLVSSKPDIRAAVAVFKKIEDVLRRQLDGDFRARRPHVISFSSMLGDEGKTKLYAKFAEKIGKTLGWNISINDNGFYIYDPNPDLDPKDIEKAKQDAEAFGVQDNDDAPDYGLTIAEAITLSDRNFDDVVPGEPKLFSDGGSLFNGNDSVLWRNPADGEHYYDLDVHYDARWNQLVVTGRHVHYDDTVELINELMPDSANEFWTARDGIKQKLRENLVTEEDFLSNSISSITEIANFENSMDSSSPRHEFPNPQMEEDAKVGEKGYSGVGFVQKFKDFFTHLRNLTREFEPIQREKYGDLQYMLRQLKNGKTLAAQKAVEYMNNIIGSLDSDRYHNLQRLAYLMDMREQVIVNRIKLASGEDPDTLVSNPWGWSDEEIMSQSEAIFKIVRNDPETYAAWRTRQNTWFRLREAYHEAMRDVGFDVSSRLNRTYYFRHQMLDIMKAQHKFYGVGGTNKLAVPTNRSYLRKRGDKQGSPINLNYIQAEFEVMAQMTFDTQIAVVLKTIMDLYGSKMPKKGYTMFRNREDSIFYMANTVPGWLVNQALEKGLKDINISPDQIKKVLAYGGKYEGYFLPDDIAETLKTALADRPYGTAMRTLRSGLTAWKIWQLLSPFRAVKYNIRNLTGDAEAVFIGNPGVFKWVPDAVRDIYNWQKSKVVPPDLQEFFDLGGMQSTLQAQDITKIVELPEFRKQLGKSSITANPVKWAKGWFALSKGASNIREITLRFAAFKKFKNELDANNGVPKSYAASLKEEVDILPTNADKAFMMSNDLLGAYDRISVGGENLRRFWVPFWSFQEVNMKRALTMFRNAARDDQILGHIGRSLGARTPILALKLGMLGLKFMVFSALINAWNEWKFGDAEDRLPEEMRQRSHIILSAGDPDNPNVVYFPRIGVVGDLLEWFGLESLPSDGRDITKILTGEKTWEQQAREMERVFHKYKWGRENLDRVLNKMAQSLGPQYKGIGELAMGEKFFPSIHNRQPITDYGRWLTEQFGFQDVYDKVVGRPQRRNVWGKAARGIFWYEEDQDRLGWLAVQQAVSKYQEENNLSGKGFIVTESGTALYNFGLSWRYGDKPAMQKYLTEYILLSVNKLSKVDFQDSIASQWEKLHPVAKLPEIHRKIFMSQLLSSERGRKQWESGLKYYLEMKSGVQFVKGG